MSRSNSPNRRRFIANSKLLAFNGGFKGGVTTILIHAYLTVPGLGGDRHDGQNLENPQRPLRHEIRRHDSEDRRRQRLAGVLRTQRQPQVHLQGKQQSYLLAKCPDGHLNAKGTAIFSDGTDLTGTSSAPAPRRASSKPLTQDEKGKKGRPLAALSFGTPGMTSSSGVRVPCGG